MLLDQLPGVFEGLARMLMLVFQRMSMGVVFRKLPIEISRILPDVLASRGQLLAVEAWLCLMLRAYRVDLGFSSLLRR